MNKKIVALTTAAVLSATLLAGAAQARAPRLQQLRGPPRELPKQAIPRRISTVLCNGARAAAQTR